MAQLAQSNEYTMECMLKALEMARSALALANMSTPVGSRPVGEPHPDTLPIAILAAALFAHVEPDQRP